MNRMDGKVCVVTGLDPGPRRRDRPAPGGGRRRRPRRPSAATQAKGAAVAEAISRDDTACRCTSSRADLGSVEDCRRVIAEAEQALRPGATCW